MQAETTSIMAKKKEYNNDNPVTMASEPSVAYMGSVTMPLKASRKGSMSVEAYFDKVRKALDKRYVDRIIPSSLIR